jgi:hypothetical protein
VTTALCGAKAAADAAREAKRKAFMVFILVASSCLLGQSRFSFFRR